MATAKTNGTTKSCKCVKTQEYSIKTINSYENDKSQWALGTVRAGQGPGGAGQSLEGPGRAGQGWGSRPGPATAGQGREGPAGAKNEMHIAKRAGQGPEPQMS